MSVFGCRSFQEKLRLKYNQRTKNTVEKSGRYKRIIETVIIKNLTMIEIAGYAHSSSVIVQQKLLIPHYRL